MMGLTNALSSITINESSNKCQDKRRLVRNCTSLSLPNLLSSDKINISTSLLSFRTKYSDCGCDDEPELADQPVDFSQKCSETKHDHDDHDDDDDDDNNANDNKEPCNNSFSMYAETDLDQPTDYSLRYCEEDSDSDECNKISKESVGGFIQDTIKTYCTEDTPYETPFNFSTATSMSDLRIDDKTPLVNKLNSEPKHDTSKILVDNRNKIIKSEFSSGLMSPEKPVNYCEEGTPGYFSRVPSFSSLNEPNKMETKKSAVEIKDKDQKRVEVKVVKFEEVVNYAEETPLMFSRSSSLASLDSIEQHSIHDDRSSVVSDFSRLPSGLVSPSELPDSPTQTVPPSPKPRKTPHSFTKTKNETPAIQPTPKPSVFEDNIKKFKLESTPIQFSRATSLSSLTIDDHEEDGDGKAAVQQPLVEEEKVPINESNNILNIPEDLGEDDEDDEDGDEDILAACINIGMQNNKYTQHKATSSTDLKVPVFYQNNSTSPMDVPSTSNLSIPRTSPQVLPSKDVTSDTFKAYCTEDTPAILSHAGSVSDLSVLSAHDCKIDKDFLSDISSDDEDDTRLLEECIKSGMASSVNQSNEVRNLENPSTSNNLGLAFDAGVSKPHASSSSQSSISEESYASERALLQECILAGMPKKRTDSESRLPEESNELTEAEQVLLEQCILEGMMQNRPSSTKKLPNSNDLTEAEQALLKECILLGMPKNNFSKSSRNSNELTDAEQSLLDQCIQAGMPKKQPANTSKVVSNRLRISKAVVRKTRELEKNNQPEHTCCIHCPRNQQKQQLLAKQNHVRVRKKSSSRGHERNQLPVKETRDFNILYVTSQILAMRKEMVDRSHEEWI